MSDPEELRVPFETLEKDEVLLTADRNSDIDYVVSVLLDEPELENERLLMTESRFGRLAKSQLQEFKTLEKENIRLKRIVADLELDKLILKGEPETANLDYLKPKA